MKPESSGRAWRIYQVSGYVRTLSLGRCATTRQWIPVYPPRMMSKLPSALLKWTPSRRETLISGSGAFADCDGSFGVGVGDGGLVCSAGAFGASWPKRANPG